MSVWYGVDIMDQLSKLLAFVKLTNDFKNIERDIPQLNGFKQENDAEHSYQLAMVSWYLATTNSTNLNVDKILKYALVHDLPEVYAGDTPLYTTNNEQLHSKKDREAKAISKLKEVFSDFDGLHIWIKKYEKRIDDESKFVYAVDKLLPILSIYLDNGHAWKTHKIDIESLILKNKDQIGISPIAEKYFNLIIETIKNSDYISDRHPIIFEKVVTHDNERCDVHHIDVEHFDDIPDNKKLKAHAVCMHNGKMLLVNHPEWDIWSVPGGTRDKGESIEETLKREVEEETNCRVVDYRPIAVQKIISPGGNKYHYRLQYLCDVIPLGDFKKDPAGNISKITWIDPNKFEEYIENKEFKKVIIRRVIDILRNHENRKN